MNKARLNLVFAVLISLLFVVKHSLALNFTLGGDHSKGKRSSIRDDIDDEINQGHWINQREQVSGYSRKSSPMSNLPKDFTWANKDGVNYINNVVNQHIPEYCGS